MRRLYSWSPIEVSVQAPTRASLYTVTLTSDDFRSVPMKLDARWGADHAARIGLDLYYQAWLDPKGFFASERLESGHMNSADAKAHLRWSEQIVEEAAQLGCRLEAAIAQAKMPTSPVDVSPEVELYFELVDLGRDAAIAGLIERGADAVTAEAKFIEQASRDSQKRFRLVPRLRPARSGT